MPSPSHQPRHQSSLEGVFNLLTQPSSLSPEQRQLGIRTFTAVVEACEPLQVSQPYKKVTLVRFTYEHACSEAARDDFLRFFFDHTQIPIDASQSESISPADDGPRVAQFADTLMENFFLPLKASTRKTPQPSPAALSDVRSVKSVPGTTQRLANLRRACLIRDRHRCVISRTFDYDEARARVDSAGVERAQDDEGNFLNSEQSDFQVLEVAHIIPHSLMTLSGGNEELDASKKTALAILNMFHDGVVHLIEGGDIDRPRNAMTLTPQFHQLFGRFDVYFEPQGNQLHTYRIDSVQNNFLRPRTLPITRSLFLTDDSTIDPPSPRLLAIHAAIAHILWLSGAGSYIDEILRDLDQGEINVDGSTELGYFTSLRLGGWWDGRIDAY